SVIIRARYEGGVLRPLDKIKKLRDGEVIIIKILGKDIAEEVFGSIKAEKVERALREAEDEFGLY
ncbi:MAG: antitoxin family protein, partial [Caldisphaeraceae archaeon]|nr:antitoxin family protein [Caldisphaeraceae archaeon]